MDTNIRWLLTESKVSSLNPQIVNFENNKLICYHLTNHRKWAAHNKVILKKLKQNPDNPERIINKDDERATRIVKSIHNKQRNKPVTISEIEEEVISDILGDPYTNTTGFRSGSGDHHGMGLYTCYKFNPNIARVYGNICLVFEIDISNFLICAKDLAKKVHGKDWKIKDQLMKIFTTYESNEENISKFNNLINKFSEQSLFMTDSIDEEIRNSMISYEAQRIFQNERESVYDGIIMFGGNDGPVCASFYPKYDAKMIGLGRLDENRPDIVTWYDSIDDFVGGTAKNKLDFETMNDIAEENDSPEEVAEMKQNDRSIFNMNLAWVQQLVSSGNFVSLLDKCEILKKDATKTKDLNDFYKKLFTGNIYDDLRASISLNSTNVNFLFNDEKYNTLFNDLIANLLSLNVPQQKKTDFCETILKHIDTQSADSTFKIFDYNLVFLLKSLADKDCTMSYHYERNRRSLNKFASFLSRYKRNYDVSSEALTYIDDFLENYVHKLAMASSNIKVVVDHYSEFQNKEEIIDIAFNRIVDGCRLYQGIENLTRDDYNIYNEILENIIKTNRESVELKNNALKWYGEFMNYPRIQLSEYILDYLLEVYNNTYLEEKAKTDFAMCLFYYSKNYPISHELKGIMSNQLENYINDAESVYKSVKAKLDDHQQLITVNTIRAVTNTVSSNQFLKAYIDSLPHKEIKDFIVAIIQRVYASSIKLDRTTTKFINVKLYEQDIVLAKDEQEKYGSIIPSNDYHNKNKFALYKHIDPDVFIQLVEKDMKSGGTNSDDVCKDFGHAIQIYSLLYKHDSIVELFTKSAKLSTLINITNMIIELVKGMNPTVSFTNVLNKKTNAPVSQAIDVNNHKWFIDFLNALKASPAYKRFHRKVDRLEIEMKIAGMLDKKPDIDLSHRRIVGRSLKEVYYN